MAGEESAGGSMPWSGGGARTGNRFRPAVEKALTSGAVWWPVLYVSLWVLTMGAICSYYDVKLKAAFETPVDYAKTLGNVLRETLKAPAEHASAPATVDEKLDAIAGAMHPRPEEAESIVKMEIVILLSCLWFATFKTVGVYEDWHRERFPPRSSTDPRAGRRRDHRWPRAAVVHIVLGPLSIRFAFALLASWPALLFAHRMINAYEPAVLVMALVAILVAAEHYAGLEKAEKRVEAATETIEKVNLQNDILLNSEGLSTYKRELYELYGKATYRIDAVVHHIDIDEIWWQQPTHDSWDAYFKQAATDPTTLYGALQGKKASFQYVVPMPLPPVIPTSGSTEGLLGGDDFRRLMGLAWQCVVLAELARGSGCATNWYARIRIVDTPCWMHVVDNTSYQVLQRGAGIEASARNLTRGATKEGEAGRISDWARRNIRRIAHRGSPAEEYLDSMLAWAGFFDTPRSHSEQSRLDERLDRLGMGSYLDSSEREAKSGRDGRTLCREIFTRFIEVRRGQRCAGVDDRDDSMPL
jgi:hypothetical protein